MKIRLFSIISIILVLLTFLAYNIITEKNVVEYTRAIMVWFNAIFIIRKN